MNENVEAVKAEFSNYLSKEDMERMDQLITGINAWANKYGKEAEDFYPDVDELTAEEEENEDDFDGVMIGGDGHDLWWFTDEEKEAYMNAEDKDAFFGV